MPQVEIGLITRHMGVGDQVMYMVHAKYPGGEPFQASFTGSLNGAPGPVLLAINSIQSWVSHPERFGPVFNEGWVERFYEDVRVTPAEPNESTPVGRHSTPVRGTGTPTLGVPTRTGSDA